MPAAAASEEDCPCSGCLPFERESTPEGKRNKKSASKKEKKKKENSPGHKKDAAGGDSQCKDRKEVRRLDQIETSRSSATQEECKSIKESEEKLCTEMKVGSDEKCDSAKDRKSGKDKRKDKFGKFAKRKDDKVKTKVVQDAKLSAVYSCSDIQREALPELCKEAEMRAQTCKQTEKEIKRQQKEARRRARSECSAKRSTADKMFSSKFKCRNTRKTSFRGLGRSTEANCARCCDLLGLYLKETYKFYKGGCCSESTHFQQTFIELMKTLACMCRDCLSLVRYICHILFV